MLLARRMGLSFIFLVVKLPSLEVVVELLARLFLSLELTRLLTLEF